MNTDHAEPHGEGVPGRRLGCWRVIERVALSAPGMFLWRVLLRSGVWQAFPNSTCLSPQLSGAI